MTIDLKINDSSDVIIDGFDLQLVDGLEQLRQNLLIRLKFFSNDWFLDTRVGIPYYEDIFIKAPNRIRIENVLKQEILNTDGINEILDFESDFNNNFRNFTVKFTALSDQGQFDLEVTL